MMRQAGRSLPEYREIRAGRSFMELVHDPKLSAEVTLQPIRRFGMDAAVIFCDILVPAEAMGRSVSIVEGTGPIVEPPVCTRDDVESLNDFVPERDTAFLAEAMGLVRAELGDERAMIGFCGAPFTLASYMVEGRSSRNYERTKGMMLGEPETFARLMERIVDNSIPYLELQAEASADALQIFDSWGGALDEATWRTFIFPHVARLVEAAKGTGKPVILYVNNGGHLLEAMADTGADVLSLDWRVTAKDAIARVGDRCAFQGNLDPTILFSTPAVVKREVRHVIDSFAGTAGHIYNMGSGILPTTPLENTTAHWEEVLRDVTPGASA
tara:strand:+ start:1624 stop:2604 length:981 start_codon:yes stop_codon:yes gene_type:complete